MDPRVLVAWVRARLGLLMLIAVVAGVVALGVSLVQPERYRASVDLSFATTAGGTSLVAAETGVTTATGAEAAELALATLDAAAARVRRRMPTAGTVDEIQRAVDVSFDRGTGVGTVTAEASTPVRAAALANAFAGEIVALRREAARADIRQAIGLVNRLIGERAAAPTEGTAAAVEIESLSARLARLRILESLQGADVEAFEPAVAPRAPSSPKPVRNAIFVSSAALVAGVLVLVLLARVDGRVRDEEELTALLGADVLVRIPRGRFTEAFEFLSFQLQLRQPEDRGLVVTVTSLADEDGKTTVVSRVARSLAAAGAEVAAVDLDPRGRGLQGEAEGDGRPRIVAPGDDPLDIGRAHVMLDMLADGAGYVLVDAPPIPSASAAAAAAASDGVILVVDMRGSRRRDVLAAAQQLANVRASFIGIVLNRAPASAPAFVARRREREEPEPIGSFGPRPFVA